jgi:hypothetical protein
MMRFVLLLGLVTHALATALETTPSTLADPGATSHRTLLLAVLLPLGALLLLGALVVTVLIVRARRHRKRHGTAFTYAQPGASADGLVRSSAGVVVGHLATPSGSRPLSVTSERTYPHGATMPPEGGADGAETEEMSQTIGVGAPMALAESRLGLQRSWTEEAAEARQSLEAVRAARPAFAERLVTSPERLAEERPASATSTYESAQSRPS